MLDEDQISFSFASSMVDDNIEDYSHQIAEMIGLRNDSYLVQAGVSISYCLFIMRVIVVKMNNLLMVCGCFFRLEPY